MRSKLNRRQKIKILYEWELFKIQISFLDFDDIFDPNKIINNSDSIDIKTKKFNQDGIFSEKIFGNENCHFM